MSAQEATYQENFALWTGPYKVSKSVKQADGLMVSFADIKPYGEETTASPKWNGQTDVETELSPEVIRKQQEEGN
ncbi:hypothetical protein A1D29_01915 [Pasteurellaceae bacterium Orientalotternb1]|nr:hypothetical protein A1D29_01915 [Pasteurellaceae bacterium Orientalotternb1]